MTKNVFHPMDVVELAEGKYKIQVPVFEKEQPVEQELHYDTSQIEQLEKEAEEFKANWAAEKEAMLRQAEEEADSIREKAMEVSREMTEKRDAEAEEIKRKAELEAEEIKNQALAESGRIIAEAENSRDSVFAETKAAASNEGREEGWKEGMEEASRLVEHLHSIIDEAISKRQEIIDGAEMQLVNMVLLVSRKVVKVISEKHKAVVVNNIVQALRKLKSRGDVAIRVNIADLELATSHVEEFKRMVEGVKSIKVLEDTSVDKGGAIIETDFGEVDARVSSQLRQIEEKILKLAPIRRSGET